MYKDKYQKYKTKYFNLKEQILHQQQQQIGGVYRDTVYKTVLDTIKTIYNSINNLSIIPDTNRPNEPLIYVSFTNIIDVNNFSQYAGNAIIQGNGVLLGSIRAQTVFTNLGIVNYGRTNTRPTYWALVYELQQQQQPQQQPQPQQPIQQQITNSITKNGQFKSVNHNQNNSSGGHEKSLQEIGASGIIPFNKNKNICYYLLGYDPNQNQWKYFGGAKENTDNNERQVAYREAKEKTCDLNNINKCYLPLKSIIFPALENGNGFVIPKYDNQSNYWNNFYFISIDKDIWDKSNGGSDILIYNIQNNEVNRMRWFTGDEIFVAIENNNIHPTLGKLHAPIIAIFRDHINEINNLCN